VKDRSAPAGLPRRLWDHFGVSDRERRQDDVPPGDPSGIDEPHDVLAAEEFAMPARDERYPADPTGIPEPHDVLAAEEFAMPAPGGAAATGLGERDPRTWIPLIALALVVAVLLRRRR
jgi:hypothetical protein